MQNKSRLEWVIGVASLLVFWGLWEGLAGLSQGRLAAVLPPPSVFLRAMLVDHFRIGLGAQSSTIGEGILATLGRVSAGMMIAFIGAFVLGVLISLSQWARMAMTPILRLLAPIAPIGWIPLAIMVFGLSNLTAIFIVFMGVFFVLTLATIDEIQRLPNIYSIEADNLKLTLYQKWRFVVIPAILPGIFTILRHNLNAAWMAVLAAEMVGIHDGIGAMIMMGRNLFNANLILFGMVLIGVIGFMLDKILRLIQQKFLWWRAA